MLPPTDALKCSIMWYNVRMDINVTRKVPCGTMPSCLPYCCELRVSLSEGRKELHKVHVSPVDGTSLAERRGFGDGLSTGAKRFLKDYNGAAPQKLSKVSRLSTDGESPVEDTVAASEHFKKSPLSPNRSLQSAGLPSPSKLLHHNSSTGSFRESPRPSGQDPNLWTVEEVVKYIRDIDPVLAPHADLFRKHEIDGKALLLLRSDMMMKYMGLKLGPALKLTFHIDKLKRA